MAATRTITPREREREIVLATRALFDERGIQDAPIEDIANFVGIARGLIYRHFSSKEELFTATVDDYLGELAGLLTEIEQATSDPVARLEHGLEVYAGFCQRHPAFLDCALSIMRRPARDLAGIVSEAVWLRLGEGIASCVDPLVRALRAGVASGAFAIDDPDYMANVLWTQVLGVMHLARIRVGMRRSPAGAPELFVVSPDQVVRTCVASALATVGATRR